MSDDDRETIGSFPAASADQLAMDDPNLRHLAQIDVDLIECDCCGRKTVTLYMAHAGNLLGMSFSDEMADQLSRALAVAVVKAQASKGDGHVPVHQ